MRPGAYGRARIAEVSSPSTQHDRHPDTRSSSSASPASNLEANSGHPWVWDSRCTNLQCAPRKRRLSSMMDSRGSACRLVKAPRGPQRRKLDRTMKVAIDTRYDTLEEALAVVALAFGTSTKGATRKPKPAAKKATSGRRPGGQRAALAETKAADTATATASPSETTDPTRRAGARKSPARKAPVAKTATPKAPPKKSTTRKPVVTGPATSRAVAEPGTATQAAVSKAPATRTVTKSASANGSGVKPKRVAAKKASRAQAQPPKPANVAPPGQSDTIRAWARSQGMQVADAGRMSAAVIAAYKAHHN
jgi:hypothetical protein